MRHGKLTERIWFYCTTEIKKDMVLKHYPRDVVQM